MEVRPGYKQTEVGVIPDDWETDTMLRISRQIMDYRGRTPKKLRMEWGGGDIPALSAGNVKKGFVDFSEECYFGSDELYSRWMAKGDVARGDILFTTEAPLGNVALVPDDRRYILSQRTILLQVAPQRTSSTFLFQMMLSGRFQRMLADYSSGSTAKGIQRKRFEQLSVALPSLPEQRAIAAVLSDADALLGELDRLIAKKRDIKQAAMQQLLTGQTRLPGFSGEWQLNPFSGVLVRLNSKAYQIQTSDYQATGRYPVVDQGKEAVVGFSDRGEKRFRCPDGGVIVFGDHTCFVKFIEFDFLVGADGTQILQGRAGQSTRFLAFQLQHRGVEPTGYNRHFKFLKERDFSVPPFKEQIAIAAVLSDMDAELAALEACRDKTRDLKQAMMQELLTGKTRLVPAGAAHA